MPGRRLAALLSFSKYTGYTIKVPQRTYTQSSSPIESQKRFSRGGQNLSERFLRLEKKKYDLGQNIPDTSRPLTPIPPSTPQRPSDLKLFRGLVIPEVPKAPEPDGVSFISRRLPSFSQPVECCMSGCAVCVHDLYQESLDDYNASVAAVRASLTNMKVPEDEWPETIGPGAEKRMSSNTSLGAFQEMERALKARREAQAQS